MVSQYIVVQYGNVMTGEYLNIGIYSYDIDKPQVYSKFITDFTRIRNAFGGGPDIMFEEHLMEWLKKVDNKEALQKIIDSSNSPYSSLQLMPPRGSLTPGESLAEDVAKTFLTE